MWTKKPSTQSCYQPDIRMWKNLPWSSWRCVVSTLSVLLFLWNPWAASRTGQIQVAQLTDGPAHHFFGYIGQSMTIPWNGDGRYILCLETPFHDRMPSADDVAVIALIDTENENRVVPLDQTRAWNFQQGTMFYWNPAAPDTQFFFNDRDPRNNHVFPVLYDIASRKRIREYRDAIQPTGNGGVSPDGRYVAAINYGRMARERPVTGYPDAYDWNSADAAPRDDGLFLVDVESGAKKLLLSFYDLREKARAMMPTIDEADLYLNHTLWNRNSDTLYFYLRGSRGAKEIYVNIPCTVRADGSEFTLHEVFIGGHPEWGHGNNIIGRHDERQVVYNIDARRIVRTLGTAEVFPKPGGDIALSPDGTWLVNGSSHGGGRIQFDFLRLADGKHVRSPDFSRGPHERGALRIDPAPRWNRESNAILVSGWTASGTRQLFVLRLPG